VSAVEQEVRYDEHERLAEFITPLNSLLRFVLLRLDALERRTARAGIELDSSVYDELLELMKTNRTELWSHRAHAFAAEDELRRLEEAFAPDGHEEATDDA
jgi:hypothetical protein